MSETPHLRTGFLIAAATVVGVLWYGALAPRNPDFDTTTVLEAWREPGVLPLVGATAALAVLFVSHALCEALAGAASAVLRRADVSLAVALLGITLMWARNDTSLSGDALDIVQRTARGDVSYDHPLTGLLFVAVHRWTGADAYDGVRLTSCVAGTLYALAAVTFAAQTFTTVRQRFTATVLLLTAGCVALFSGSVEVYALPALTLLVFLVVALRRLRDEDTTRGPFLGPALAFGAFAACHGVAAFVGAAVVVLLVDERRRGASLARLGIWCAVAALPGAVSVAVIRFADLAAQAAATTESQRFLPFMRTAGNVQHRYAFADAEHLVGVLATLFVAGPAAWALLAARGRAAAPTLDARRNAGRTELRFLLAATAPLVALPFFWSLAYSLRRDWDLFSLVGIPLALLATRTVVAAGLSRVDALRIAALAWFAFLPFQSMHAGDIAQRRDHAIAVRWTLAAAGATSDVTARWDARIRDLDPRGVADRVGGAFDAFEAGRTADAEALARAVLADEPENVHALTLIGEILVGGGLVAGPGTNPAAAVGTDSPAAEAESLLRRAIRHPRENLRPRPRLALAKLMLAQGRKEAARAQLDRLVREDCRHPVVAEALTMLAPLVRDAGDTKAAAEIVDLAARRRGD